MRHRAFVFAWLMLSLSLISGCVPPTDPEPSGAETSKGLKEQELSYTVNQSDEPITRQRSSPFDLSADNCDRLTDAQLSISQAQEFRVYLELDVPRSISTQLGGEEAAEERLRAELQRVLDFPLGATKSVETSHQITVPSDSKSVARLQWQEIWTAGTISIQGADGRHIGEVPYAVLDTVQLVELDEGASRCPDIPDPTQLPPSSSPPSSSTSGSMPAPKSVEYDGGGFVWVWAGQDEIRGDDWYFDIKFYHNFFSEFPYTIIVAEPAKTERAEARWRYVLPGTIDSQCGSFWTVQVAKWTSDDTFAGFLSPESERLPTKQGCDPESDPDREVWAPKGSLP